VVALAATLGTAHPGSTLRTVGQMAAALVPLLGSTGARVLLGVGVLGAGLVAALVASLAGAWALAEVFGWQHSLNRRPGRDTAPFYGTYTLALAAGALLVLTRSDLISLAVDAEVLNAVLLPVVLGFLLLLEARALPPAARPAGCAESPGEMRAESAEAQLLSVVVGTEADGYIDRVGCRVGQVGVEDHVPRTGEERSPDGRSRHRRPVAAPPELRRGEHGPHPRHCRSGPNEARHGHLQTVVPPELRLAAGEAPSGRRWPILGRRLRCRFVVEVSEPARDELDALGRPGRGRMARGGPR
jgi:hypothetical protein